MKKNLYIAFFAILSSEIFSQNSFDFSLPSPIIQPGEVISFQLTIPENANLNDKLLTENKNIIILDKNETKEKTLKHIRYQITFLETGEHSIPPIEIQKPGESYSTTSKKVAVNTTREPTDEQLRPSLPAEGFSFPYFKFLFFLILSIGLFYIYKHYKDFILNFLKKPDKEEVALFNLEEWLHNELIKLFRELKKNPDILMADRINYLVRNFLELQKKAPVLSLTTKEIHTLIANLELDNILKTTDFYKFSQSSPESIRDFQFNLFQTTKQELLKCLNS